MIFLSLIHIFQLYVRRDELGDEPYAAFKKLDVGDIIGVKGEVFRTKMCIRDRPWRPHRRQNSSRQSPLAWTSPWNRAAGTFPAAFV